MSSLNNKPRTINVRVNIDNILAGSKQPGGLPRMIEGALKQAGYKASSVDGTEITVSTKAGHQWRGKAPRDIAKKLIAAASLKARPNRMKPFAFPLVLTRVTSLTA